MSERPALLGAVLAGGRSRRYGRDKATVEVGGRAMLERATSTLLGVTEAVVVVSSRPVSLPAGTSVIPDQHQDVGPIGGLHAALLEASARGLDGVFLLACDLPLVDSDVVRSVISAGHGARACAPARGDGVEPLCALWRTDVLPEIESRIATGRFALHGLFSAVGGRRVEALAHADGTSAFLNVNTPDDRALAETLLTGTIEP